MTKTLYFLCSPTREVLVFEDLNQVFDHLSREKPDNFAKKVIYVNVSDKGEVVRSRVHFQEILKKLHSLNLSQKEYKVILQHFLGNNLPIEFLTPSTL